MTPNNMEQYMNIFDIANIKSRASLVAQLVKNLPAVQEIWVRSLGWEDFPGEGNGYPFQYSGLDNSMDV